MGAGFFKEGEQGIGIKVFSFPHGDEVLVAEFGGVPVGLEVVLVVFVSFYIEITRVPLALFGDGVDAPVEVDAEFGIAKPVRAIVLRERFNGGFEFFLSWALCAGDLRE